MASTALNSAPAQPSERIDYRRLLWVAPLAAAVAAVVNALIFLIADAAGLFPDDVLLANGQRMGVGPVVSLSIVGVVGAALVYALTGWLGGRFTRRPIRLFAIVAAVVLILSFASPFSIPGAGAGYIAVLELLHVTTAAIAVGLLTGLARRA